MLVTNLNEALPIKDYKDIIAGVRGYYLNNKYYTQVQYHYFGGNNKECHEIETEFERISKNVSTLDMLLTFTNGEECNYWSQTEHFYYWTRLNPKFGHDDYCIYIKAYRKE